jgi:hypothetical protein
MEVGPIIEVIRFTFLVKASRTSISFRMNLSSMVSGHVGGAVQSSTASYVHLFVFFFLVTGFNPAWFGHYGFLVDEGHVRHADEKHLRCTLAGAVKEDYGAGLKMGHAACTHVLPGVGSMGSPE